MTTLRQAKLPDGTRIFTVRPQEVAAIYQQVQEYCRHGIRVKEGDIVFDVGANIGLFALWLRQSVSRNIRVFSFEPIPVVFDALRHNAQRFDPQNWKVFSCGLGRRSGTATFGYFSRVTAMSSAYPDTSIVRQVVVEVHDLNGRLAKATALLAENGLDTIHIEQEPLFRGSEIYNLYARRPDSATAI